MHSFDFDRKTYVVFFIFANFKEIKISEIYDIIYLNANKIQKLSYFK